MPTSDGLVVVPINNKVIAKNDPYFIGGFDWSLPAYAGKSNKGGMLGDGNGNDSDIAGAFLEVLWSESEPNQGEFDFSHFQQRLDQIDGSVLVRLEVNSKCHIPNWATIPYLDNQSLQFWKPQYINKVRGFIVAFANRYRNNTKIIGVHLGIADGEFYQDNGESHCPTGNDFDSLVYDDSRDGWGEFWMNESEEAQSIANGLTPENFETSVKSIIDMYVNAFGVWKNKLAFMGCTNVFGSSEFNEKLPSILQYVENNGIGNRDGEIELWMRYTGNAYGVNLLTSNSNDGSCSMTFDESFADSINGKYWGDENEFYGSSWSLDAMGPASNQSYRFFMSSMRALQMRKNYFSINPDGHTYLRNTNDEYNSRNFITYLSKTLGRTRSDTPDAFVVLGERTINTYSELFPTEYKSQNTSEYCLIHAENRGYVTVSQFGRWLSVISPTIADSSMRKNMPESEHNWGLNMIADRDGKFYELYARKSNEILFDINDQLMQERCSNGCKIEVKVVFKDKRAMNLQVHYSNGVSTILSTPGDNKIKTATFPITGHFINGFKNADFSIKTTGGKQLSILMVRINIMQ